LGGSWLILGYGCGVWVLGVRRCLCGGCSTTTQWGPPRSFTFDAQRASNLIYQCLTPSATPVSTIWLALRPAWNNATTTRQPVEQPSEYLYAVGQSPATYSSFDSPQHSTALRMPDPGVAHQSPHTPHPAEQAGLRRSHIVEYVQRPSDGTTLPNAHGRDAAERSLAGTFA